MEQKFIRNFSIIAHIDHGKSTLADRILEITNAINKRDLKEQLLDDMDIERERGITIKLNAVRLKYQYQGNEYMLNLIDTPGHVDFSYEVSRSLMACEGAILVVDATKGIQAQTLANLFLALENNLTIIPVINKIDLPNANPDKVRDELVSILGFNKDDILSVSAKSGEGVKELVERIITTIPSPKGDNKGKLKALVFDSYYDSYRGVMAIVRVMDGRLKLGDKIKMMANNNSYDTSYLAIHTPKEMEVKELNNGEVGIISASIKEIKDVKVGDTITLETDPADSPLPGYKPMKPMVFCGLYPTVSSKYPMLREALEKLKLNDAALEYTPETSVSLGFGFRCGFLGLLHMDIIKERLEREFNLDIIATSPSVIYEVLLTDNTIITIDSPIKMPEKQRIEEIREPYIKASIFVPSSYIGPIMELCQGKRGIYKDVEYIDEVRVNIHYELPLSEVVYDFFDKLKSCTKGYASFDYELIGYKASDLVKMDILLNGEVVDAFSIITHKDFAYERGRKIVNILRKVIPRQQFEIPIQASIGSKIIAREDVKAMRKDVLAKCYGGDVSRKRKLLEKQKEGKKKMKMIGSVEVPEEAFLAVLSTDENESK